MNECKPLKYTTIVYNNEAEIKSTNCIFEINLMLNLFSTCSSFTLNVPFYVKDKVSFIKFLDSKKFKELIRI